MKTKKQIKEKLKGNKEREWQMSERFGGSGIFYGMGFSAGLEWVLSDEKTK